MEIQGLLQLPTDSGVRYINTVIFPRATTCRNAVSLIGCRPMSVRVSVSVTSRCSV